MKAVGVAHFLSLASAAFESDKAGSRRACEAAVQAAPHASSAHLALGVLNHSEGRVAEARERFLVARLLAQAGSLEEAEACFALGVVAEEGGDKEDALRQFKAAVAGGHQLAALRLALLQVHFAQLHEAIQHLRVFLAGSTDQELRKDASQHLGRCLELVGRSKDAAAAWKEAGPSSALAAKAAVACGDWRAARDAFSKCLTESNSNNTRLLAGLGGALARLGDYDEALSVYRRCADLEPGEKTHAANVALMRQLMGRSEGAAADYEVLMPEEKKRAVPAATKRQMARAEKKARVGEPGEEVALVRDAAASSVCCSLGCAAMAAGHFVRARALFEKSIALDGSCWEAHYNVATLLLRAGRAADAVTRFRKCRSESFAPFELLNNMGVALIETQAFAEARTVLLEAVKMRPEDDRATINLARAEIGCGWAEAGLQLAEQAFARSDALLALQAVAAAQLATGRSAEAVETARKCLDRGAESAKSWALLGDALLACGEGDAEKLNDAKEAFRKCLARDASNSAAHGSLGRLLLADGSLAEAALHLRECVTRNPTAVEAFFDLGTALARSGEVQQAVVAFRTCVGLDAGHHRAYCSWARVLSSNGQVLGAIRCLELALRIAPMEVDYMLQLAELYTGRGENKLARALLQRVLAVAPEHAEAKARLIKLF
jgi:Flp pilus assembly protein TadD